jgi:hypothetical protein
MKREGIAKKFNGKFFICNKIGHQTKDYINKDRKRNSEKRISQASVTKVDQILYHCFQS